MQLVDAYTFLFHGVTETDRYTIILQSIMVNCNTVRNSRTDFDLSQHEKFSGKKIQYFDPELNKSYTPYVIETSIGVDRVFLSVMAGSYCEETLENGETRVVLKLPAALAPIKLAVLPLVKKDGLPEKAEEIVNMLKFDFRCQYDEKDSIGKRYRRQDAIGTPYCITVS